ncbi:TIGR02757 family protein [Thermodesulfovibrio sp. 3907-1M]|uniref:TIGR02757 family protein n=1 Tax=Thermodesulfovibrio autotrophicus TaxID=3118333 RepID=A0AAU8H0V6_9BACT
MDKIRDTLERLYHTFNFETAIQKDPIRFPKRYREPLDIETAGIISSSFAYGSIKCFCSFLEGLFNIMGSHPSEFILNFKPSYLLKKLSIKYRFSNVDDIVAYLFIIQKLIQQSPSNSLEYYFHGENTILKISNFVQWAFKVNLTSVYGKNTKTKGLIHLLPDPLKGSPCKRINLFLRWMIRNHDIDFGLWKTIKPSELIIPLDVHVLRVSKRIGLTKKSSQSMKTALEITEKLRKINPSDPLKYDFVLCHGDINRLI